MSNFIAYLPAGYPDVTKSIEGYKTLIDAGADILEIGVPYSDPVMDGKSIQNATKTALDNGFNIVDLFTIIHEVQEYIQLKLSSGQLYYTPQIYIMTYYNIVLKFGIERFVKLARNHSVEGLIIPDLIPDEAGTLLRYCRGYGLKNVFLTALNSSDERLDVVTNATTGFVYATALLGTTGVRENAESTSEQVIINMIKRIKDSQIRTRRFNPIYVGLGVSNPQQARAIAEVADGVIVGSALVDAFTNDLSELYALAKSLADVIK